MLLELEEEYCNAPYVFAGLPAVHTKLDMLFLDHPQATRLRQSIIETCGVNNFSVLTDKVQDIVGGMEDFPDSLMQAVCIFAEKVDQARAHPSLIDYASEVFPVIYPCYVSAVVSNSDYYLSDIELLCLCRCARQNVVICKFDTVALTLTYHKHSIVNDGDMILSA